MGDDAHLMRSARAFLRHAANIGGFTGGSEGRLCRMYYDLADRLDRRALELAGPEAEPFYFDFDSVADDVPDPER